MAEEGPPENEKVLANETKESAAYQGRRPWWILSDESRYVQCWELIVMCTLCYVAIVTPYEVAFIHPKPVFDDEVKTVWFALNRVLESIFAIDICVSFCRAFRDESQTMIHHPRRIAKRYIQTWFFLDVVSTVPYDLIIAATNGDGDSSGTDGPIKLVRILRVVRLLKLARLLKGIAVLRHFAVEFSIDYNMLEVFKFMFVTVLYAHWMACVMVVTTNLQESTDSFLMPNYADMGFETFEQLRTSVAPESLYLVSLYWSVMTITTIGYGDVTPVTEAEQLVTCVCMLLGAFHFGYVIGTVGSILNSRNMKQQKFREKLNNLNQFMDEFRFKSPFKRELRQFTHYEHSNTDLDEYHELLANLSPKLRGVVSQKMNSKWIKKLKVFQGASPSFIYDFSTALRQVIYPPMETIIEVNSLNRTMHILKRGLVRVHGIHGAQVKGSGEIFGSLCLYKEMVTVTKVEAATYTTLFEISAKQAEEVLHKYPSLQKRFRLYAIRSLFFEEIVSFKNACNIRAEERKLELLSEPERHIEKMARVQRIHTSQRTIARAAKGFGSKEEKLLNASKHPRVRWYLNKLRIQSMCDEIPEFERRVIHIQRVFRKYLYSNGAAGTLRSQQSPSMHAVPKMLLNLTHQVANLRRYMEDAGLISKDVSADMLVDVASETFKAEMTVNDFSTRLGTPIGKKSKRGNLGKLLSVLTAQSPLQVSARRAIARISEGGKRTPFRIEGGGAGGGGGGGGMSAAQMQDVVNDVRAVVREELKKALVIMQQPAPAPATA